MRARPPRSWRSRPARGLRAARRGVAALEFALTVPVLVFMLFGMYDLSMGWITWQRLVTSANSVGQVATMLAARFDGTNWLTTAQAWQAATAINAAMPETRLAGAHYTVVLSEILFAPPDSSCNSDADEVLGYCATVLWSTVVLSQDDSTLKRRQCGYQHGLENTASPVQTGLPKSVFQANPVLVVDVTYTFTPLFLSGLLGQFPMTHAVYYPSRIGSVPTGVDQLIGYGDLTDSNGKPLPDRDAYCLPLPAILSTPS